MMHCNQCGKGLVLGEMLKLWALLAGRPGFLQKIKPTVHHGGLVWDLSQVIR
jgi:hypothetical protein